MTVDGRGGDDEIVIGSVVVPTGSTSLGHEKLVSGFLGSGGGEDPDGRNGSSSGASL